MNTMTHRERFRAVFNYEPVDRIPLYFFGTWYETNQRWKEEGLDCEITADIGPQVPGMDPDWEPGLWDFHGLTNILPMSSEATVILDEKDDYVIERTGIGEVIKRSKQGSSIHHTIEYPLKPTRESWNNFKRFLDADDPDRYPQGWQSRAEKLNSRDRVAAFLGGSLYGFPRNWMGVESLSYLPYDDPVLFEEILDYYTEFTISLYRPILEKVEFDFAYIFEDCCFNTGPLLSPDLYSKFFDKYYKRLFGFYKDAGVPFILLDSDGKVDDLVPCWLESGVDIVFPVEVGTWHADPVRLRRDFGKELRMMGGVNKHVIAHGAQAIREHLTHLKPLVEEGGYLPIPDHRISPECSLNDFLTYVDVYKEVFFL